MLFRSQGHEDRALHAHLRAQGHPGPGPEPEEGGRPAQWGGRGGPLLQKPLLEQLLHEAAHGALGEACGPGQVGAGEGAPPELVQDGPAVEPAEGLDVALTLRALLSSFPGLTKARAPPRRQGGILGSPQGREERMGEPVILEAVRTPIGKQIGRAHV